MARAYRLTPARRTALRKAQIASARARKGKGKGQSRGKSRSTNVATRKRRLRTAKRVAAVAAVAGAVAGTGYVYKNRERLIIAPQAERTAIRIATRKAGRKLTKAETEKVRMTERVNHAHRSTYRAREYMKVRKLAQKVGKQGLSLRPSSKNYAFAGKGLSRLEQDYIYSAYRKDVNSRARHRLNRLKGRKAQGFGYGSGKVRVVWNGRVIKMPF